MNVSKSNNANVQLLACLVEPQDTIESDGSHCIRLPHRRALHPIQVAFVETDLAGVDSLWHPEKLTELDFFAHEYVRQRFRIPTHPEQGKNARVVGFVAEWVQDGGQGTSRAEGRPWGDCMSLGSGLATPIKTTFLCGKGRRDVVLVDFETAKTCSPQELEDELNALQESKPGGLEFPGRW
ncbi:hypothetical protein FPV67DRAFT_1765970 [Lyophyllum atratum]|nr:hypothetical protein FPV67DRAFT_1765970 [Lyophyllum atratum]